MAISRHQQQGAKYPLLITVSIALLLYASAGTATLIKTSDPNIIIDSSTQLEWLSPTLSIGKSYDEMNTALGIGLFTGFRYAAPAELFLLLQGAGLTVNGSPQPSELAAANHFLNLFGATATQTPSGAPMKTVLWGITNSTINGLQATGGILMQLSDIPRTFCGCLEPPFVIGGLQDPSQPESGTGSWLVRAAVTTVPEPGSWALMGMMLLGLMARQRHRQKIAGLDCCKKIKRKDDRVRQTPTYI